MCHWRCSTRPLPPFAEVDGQRLGMTCILAPAEQRARVPCKPATASTRTFGLRSRTAQPPSRKLHGTLLERCARHRQHGVICERVLRRYCAQSSRRPDAVERGSIPPKSAYACSCTTRLAYIDTIPTNARADQDASQSGSPAADAGLLIPYCDTSDTRTMRIPPRNTLCPGSAFSAEVCVAFLLGLAGIRDSTIRRCMAASRGTLSR